MTASGPVCWVPFPPGSDRLAVLVHLGLPKMEDVRQFKLWEAFPGLLANVADPTPSAPPLFFPLSISHHLIDIHVFDLGLSLSPHPQMSTHEANFLFVLPTIASPVPLLGCHTIDII